MTESATHPRRRPDGPADAEVPLPLLLLPVRLETVFGRRSDGTNRLVVRVFPDTIHTDVHQPVLQGGETEAGRRFWVVADAPRAPRARLEAEFARLAARLGPFRAAWVLEVMRPTKTAATPGSSARSSTSAKPAGRARLLPDRWLVTGYQGDQRLFDVKGATIPADLPVVPDLASQGASGGSMLDLLDAQGLSWIHDLEAAEQVGMAIGVDLPPQWSPALGLDVYVTGHRAQAAPESEADAVAELLAAHQWTHGVDFVRRGTPTTTTDESAGVSVLSPDLSALLDLVLGRPVGPGRPDGGRPKTSRWHERTFAEAAASALGLGSSVLDRAGAAGEGQLGLGPAMNAALWPVTWGYAFRDVLAGVVADSDVDWLRERFVHDVPAGGVLPTLRCGRQPYGLHPVLVGDGGAVGPAAALRSVLDALRGVWADAAPSVARLDPDAPDVPGDAGGARLSLEEASVRLARIVGATPNPSDLLVRGVRDESELYQRAWGTAVFVLAIVLSVAPDVAAELGDQIAAASTLEALMDVLADSIHAGAPASGAIWLLANDARNSQEVRDAGQAAVELISSGLLNGGPLHGTDADGQPTTSIVQPLLGNHLTRISPVLDLGPDRTRVTGLPGDPDAPPLFGSLFDETATPWTGPLVTSSSEPASWLAALLVELDDPGRPAAAPQPHAPLLFQLLQHAVRSVADRDAATARWGLQTLAAAVADGRLHDPVADLEILMGETLGACMHRIDAWYTGYAVQALEDLRRRRPQGLAVGGYGLVLGLRRRPAGAGRTQGFVHAPSTDLAATAAILRSGWSALGGGGESGGGLALDLSSGAVRAASWIVDGVRDGQRLGELLGQSVERRLHDAGLDAHVAPLRRLVLDATGHHDRPERRIVDGYLVARAWLGADQVASLTDLEHAVARLLRPYAAGAPGLDDVLDAHARDLDAVADTAVAQAVHALVRDQPQAASAALSGVSGGDAGPAALSMFGTERPGQRISHRVVLVLDPVDADPGSETDAGARSPAALAEPALDRWLGTVLPLDRVRYGARITEAGTTTIAGPWTLAGSGLSPLELLSELPDGPGLGLGRLHDRLAWLLRLEAAAAGRRVEVLIDDDPGGIGAGDLPLRLFLPCAQAMRAVLTGGRAATAADLQAAVAPPVNGAADVGGVTDVADVAELAGREAALAGWARAAAETLRTALDGAADGLADTSTVLTATAALARWQITDAVGGAGLADLAGTTAGTGAEAADRDALLTRAGTALALLDARLAARDAVGEDGADLSVVTARLAALLPGVPVLPRLAPPGDTLAAADPRRSVSRLGSPAVALRWLHQVGRTREASGAAASAIDLLEAAGGRSLQPRLVQLPDHPGEGWAATTKPTVDDRPRTCLLALTWPDSLDPEAPQVSALAVDSWTEVIPDRRTRTGIAVHVDAPSARAPQVLLLGVPDGPWTDRSVRDLVRAVVDDATLRAVGPQDLQGWGQFLPAVHLGAEVDPGPAPDPASARAGRGGGGPA